MTARKPMNTLNRSLLLLLSLLPSLAAEIKGVATRCLITLGDRPRAEVRLISAPEISFEVGTRYTVHSERADGPTSPDWKPLVIERRYDAADGDWKQWWAEATALIPPRGGDVIVPVTYLRIITVSMEAQNGAPVTELRCEGGFPLSYSVVVGPDGTAIERLTTVATKVTLIPTP